MVVMWIEDGASVECGFREHHGSGEMFKMLLQVTMEMRLCSVLKTTMEWFRALLLLAMPE